jgi:hypothetical protein
LNHQLRQEQLSTVLQDATLRVEHEIKEFRLAIRDDGEPAAGRLNRGQSADHGGCFILMYRVRHEFAAGAGRWPVGGERTRECGFITGAGNWSKQRGAAQQAHEVESMHSRGDASSAMLNPAIRRWSSDTLRETRQLWWK